MLIDEIISKESAVILNKYIIIYDLPKNDEDSDNTPYANLDAKLLNAKAVKINQSVWLISTSKTACDVRDCVEKILGNGAEVAVITISKSYCTSGSICPKAKQWLLTHLI